MAILLGLLVSVTYGSGDFFGGLASKRARTMTVVAGSFALSATLLVAITAGWSLLGDPPTPDPADLWLGAATGVVGPIALGLLYRGLAIGRMSVVAPTTALVAASVPLVFGLATGDRPSALALSGIAVALVAVVAISGAPAHEDHPPGELAPLRVVVPMALGSGLGFGIVYVLLGSTGDDAGLWPLLVARPLSVALIAATAVVLWRSGRARTLREVTIAPRPAWAPIAVAGVLDITANAVYLAATRAGLLSIVAVLSSLYPATTVVLARVVLGERLHRLQVAGLALAAVGIVAMAAG